MIWYFFDDNFLKNLCFLSKKVSKMKFHALEIKKIVVKTNRSKTTETWM